MAPLCVHLRVDTKFKGKRVDLGYKGVTFTSRRSLAMRNGARGDWGEEEKGREALAPPGLGPVRDRMEWGGRGQERAGTEELSPCGR